MSYEGIVQGLCGKGHKIIRDCYAERENCPCGERIVWELNIDLTNGCADTEDYPIKLEILQEAKTATCEHCGMTRVLEQVTYKIPPDKGRLIKENEPDGYLSR